MAFLSSREHTMLELECIFCKRTVLVSSYILLFLLSFLSLGYYVNATEVHSQRSADYRSFWDIYSSNTWQFNFFDTLLDPYSGYLRLYMNDGSRKDIPINFVNQGGLYVCPYSIIFGIIRKDYKTVEGTELAKYLEYDFPNASLWGIDTRDGVYCEAYSDTTWLPAARVPMMFLNAYVSGWQNDYICPAIKASEYIDALRSEHGGKKAIVGMHFAGDRLLREIVKVYDHKSDEYVMSHIFDYIYGGTNTTIEGGESADDKQLSGQKPQERYQRPSKILFYSFPAKDNGDIQCTFDEVPSHPGEYGNTYEYSINKYNYEQYPNSSSVYRLDDVISSKEGDSIIRVSLIPDDRPIMTISYSDLCLLLRQLSYLN
jgi:hypothetical protein